LKSAGFEVVVLAPQRQQVIDLENDGFNAQTVAHFLLKKELPKNAVVVIDEAGQIGGKQMSDLLSSLKTKEVRVILSGDSRQHGAVEASDALRAMEKHAGLKAAELSVIRRQDPDLGKNEGERAFISEYRKAVKSASNGEILDSFERLDSLGCVEEHCEDNRKEILADDYLKAEQAGEKVLIISQTLDEIHTVNDAVRQRLKDEGLLGEGKKLTLFESRDLDNAQKLDARYYHNNDYVFFVKTYGRFQKGDLVKIEAIEADGVRLNKQCRVTTVGFKQSMNFVIARKREVTLAVGDRLQMKFNGRSVDRKPIINGELVTIVRMFKNGNITVRDDRSIHKILGPDQCLANVGYAVTSYASQGKTVDTILFSDSQNKAATNRNQWYVSISRARRKIRIYTADKEALRENVLRSGDRPLAMDLAGATLKKQSAVRKGLSRMELAGKVVLLAAQKLLLAGMLIRHTPRFMLRRAGVRRTPQSV
jgi:ATP-dependent exoDNAse (exonuclease V) alpha subunit